MQLVTLAMDTRLTPSPKMLAVGALHVDEIASLQGELISKASNPVVWQRYVGGVVSNAARAANTVYVNSGQGSVVLHASLGDDSAGTAVLHALEQAALSVKPNIVEAAATGRYSALISPTGELVLGLADVGMAERLAPEEVCSILHDTSPTAVLLDANLSESVLADVLQAARKASSVTAALSVSPAKAVRLLPSAAHIQTLFCNRREAVAMCIHANRLAPDINPAEPTLAQLLEHLREIGFHDIAITDQDNDVLLFSQGRLLRIPVQPVKIEHNVNGAGDTLAGASFAAITCGVTLEHAVQDYGLPLAREVLLGNRSPLPL